MKLIVRITQQVSHGLQIFEVYMKERSEMSRGSNKNKAFVCFWVITCFSLRHFQLLWPFFCDEAPHFVSEASPQAHNRFPEHHPSVLDDNPRVVCSLYCHRAISVYSLQNESNIGNNSIASFSFFLSFFILMRTEWTEVWPVQTKLHLSDQIQSSFKVKKSSSRSTGKMT